jgi:hypothetical protein
VLLNDSLELTDSADELFVLSAPTLAPWLVGALSVYDSCVPFVVTDKVPIVVHPLDCELAVYVTEETPELALADGALITLFVPFIVRVPICVHELGIFEIGAQDTEGPYIETSLPPVLYQTTMGL